MTTISRSKFHTALAGLGALTAALLLARPGAAAPFMNINFDSETIGNSVQTDTSTTLPITHPYALGGFPDTGPYTGDTIVSGAGKAGLMTTTQGGTGANYMDTQFLVANPQIGLDFDISVQDVPTTGLPQDTPSAPNGQAFSINAFALDSNRVWRFAVTPTSATTGEFAMRNNTDGDLISIGTYTEGSTHHVSILSDFNTNLVTVVLDGNLIPQTFPFVTPEPASGGFSEFFFFQNNVEGQTNQVALDNIIATVPEPSALVLAGFGLAGLSWWGRRRSSGRPVAA